MMNFQISEVGSRFGKNVLRNFHYYLDTPQKNRFKRFIIICAIIFLYFFYKSKRNRVRKLCKKTIRNLEIIKFIEDILGKFNPTFYLPNAFLMIIAGQKVTKENYLIKYEKQKIIFEDNGEMNIEWYPPNYNEIQKPIVAFILGSLGKSSDMYAKEYARLVANKGWRFVILNRRGFDNEQLQSPVFMHKNEMNDFYQALLKIYEIYKCNIYLCGISAGACHAARLLAIYGDKVPIKAFFSISNPYNFGRLAYHYRIDLIGNLFSRFLSLDFKSLFEFHRKNPNFVKAIKDNNFDIDLIDHKLKNARTLWEIDKNVTLKLTGFDHLMEYYHSVSCDHLLHNIKHPSIFLNCLEDPICYKENIPITSLYLNENIITLFAPRGGHVEYLSGINKEWWAFQLSLIYFEYFETKEKIIKHFI
jgi:predicted alpha/beta-fold hydrolase